MKKLLFLAFILPLFAKAQTVGYQSNVASQQYPYVKIDSGLAIPFRDTARYRNVNRIGLMVARPADSLIYSWNGRRWAVMGADVATLITLLNGKVDSVTVSGDSLFYWKVGVAYGYILPTAGWKTTGNVVADAHKFGSTNNHVVDFYANNTKYMTLDPRGYFGIGTASPTKPLEVSSITNGVLFPRMTTTQRDAVSSPLAGELVYNTTTSQWNYYDGANWKAIEPPGSDTWQDVLTNGATLSANNAIVNDGYTFSITGDNSGRRQVIEQKTDNTMGLYLRNTSNTDIATIGTVASDSSVVLNSVSGKILMKNLPSGASTDSILVFDYANNRVRRRNAALITGSISGSGTLNYLPKWTPNGTTLGNSLIQDDGTTLSVTSGATTQNVLNLTSSGTTGTFLNMNAPTGYTGSFASMYVNSVPKYLFTSTGFTGAGSVGLNLVNGTSAALGANSDYASLWYTSNKLQLLSDKLGSGTARAIDIVTTGAQAITLGTTGTTRLTIASGGDVTVANGLTVAGLSNLHNTYIKDTAIIGGQDTETGVVQLKGKTSGTLSITIPDSTDNWRLQLPDNTGSAGSFLLNDGGGVLRWTGDEVNWNSGVLSVAGTAKVIHLQGNDAAAPTIAGGRGAGTSPTVSITGSDIAGEITVETDTDPETNNAFCTVTFGTAFGSAPYVVLSPSNDNAARIGAAALYVSSTTTNFALKTNSGQAPAASTTYKFHYHVIQ